jgi:hypothetical protein
LREEKNVFYYLLLSVAAAILILIMVLLKPTSTNIITQVDKLILAGAFSASCIFGISLAIYPNWWRPKKNKNNSSDLKKENSARSFTGHHPDCSMFSDHVIIMNKKVRCAGCLSLLIGALISILLMILYLIFPLNFPIIIYYILLLFGFLILIFVYLEIVIQKRNAFFHIALNTLLILGFFLITISVFELTKEIGYGLLTVLFCFLWLDTRIRISKYQHSRICTYCKQSCKSF